MNILMIKIIICIICISYVSSSLVRLPCSIPASNGNRGSKSSSSVGSIDYRSSSSFKKSKQIMNFLAGGFAGTISSTITMPLEVVKTQLQSSSAGAQGIGPWRIAKKIFAQDGPVGFFRGLRPMLFGIIPTRAIYFWAYSATKEKISSTEIGNSPLNHLLSAFTAGVASNTITNPLWMVKTRYQLMADKSLGQRVFKSYGDVVQTIMKEEGPLGFFKGLTASYIGCTEGAIQWIVYEELKKRFSSNSEEKQLSSSKLFVSAAASKFAAICATYPHEVVRTRMREQAANGVFKYSDGFFKALSTIGREEGIRGLYGGLGMHLLRSVPNAAIMFVSFELVSNWLDRPSTAILINNVLDQVRSKKTLQH